MSDQPTTVPPPAAPAQPPWVPVAIDLAVLGAVVALGLRDKISSEAVIGIISALVSGRIVQAQRGAPGAGAVIGILVGGASALSKRGGA